MADDLRWLRENFGALPGDTEQRGFDDRFNDRAWLEAEFGNMLNTGSRNGPPGILERVGAGAGRALHTVNRWVKPIFLPQEILFSTIAGAADEETTIFGRLKDIDWSAFAPGVKESPEVTSGRELLSLFGIDNELVLKWGGLGLELFADPLLAGATIRWAGKGLKSAELIAFGNKLDELSSIGGLYRSSGPVKQWVDERVDVVLNAIRMNESRLLGIPSEGIRKAADRVLSRSTAARLRLGGISAEERVRLGDPGGDVVKARELGTQKAKDVFEEAYQRLTEAHSTLFGEHPRSWFQKVMTAIGKGAKAESEFVQLNQKMRDSLLKMGYDFVDNNGFLFTSAGTDEAAEITRRIVSADEISNARSRFTQLQDQVRRLAKREGLGDTAAEGLVSRFSKFVEQVTQADAQLGFHLSGYEHVQKKFMEQALKAMGKEADIKLAYDAWIEFMRRAVRDDVTDATMLNFDDIMQTVRFRGKTPPGMRGEVAIGEVNRKTGEFRSSKRLGDPQTADRFRFGPELPGPSDATQRTVGQILEGEHLFSSLNITSYIKGLRNGHMRRAYGMFIDVENFDRYIRTVKEGKIIPNNILKDIDIEDALGAEFSAEAKAIRDYLRQVTGEGTGELARAGEGVLNGSRSPRGFVVNKRNLTQSIIDDLTKQGVGRREAASRATESMRRLVGRLQPELDREGGILDRLRAAAEHYSSEQRPRAGTFGRKFFDARDELDPETLEVLGEFMNPLVSLQETISAARVRIPAQEFMRRAYNIAKEYGYVSDTPNARWVTDANGNTRRNISFRRVEEPETVYGAFSGKYLHPGLKEEIERVLRNRGDRALALQRMRQLVSGGYLAAPNVVATNAIGGIITAALAGVGPARLLKAMGQTLKPLLKDGGKDYDVLQDLTQHIGVQETSMVTQNVADTFSKLRLDEMAVGPQGVEKAMNGIVGWFEGQLRAPAGAWWAGLDGFQFVEKWLKTATFKTERERILREIGPNPSVADVARANKEAAEMARIGVFDYSELPDWLRFARDYGIIMFPGFTYFMIGRTLNSLMNRPGAFALADRLSEAVTSAKLDPDEKAIAYAAMPDWLKSEQGAVVHTYKGPDGATRSVLIPMNQIVPTNTQFGSNFAESLGTGGIWKPFAEILAAFTFADGEAVFSRHFGGQVFSPAADRLPKQLSQSLLFLYNSLAPSAIRKLIRPGDGRAEGIVPAAISRWAVPVDNELANGVYSYNELRTNTPDRRLEEELLSGVLRSTQTISLGGPINGVRKQIDREKIALQQALGALKRRYDQAVLGGNQEKANEIREEIVKRRKEFSEKWRPIIETYRNLQQRQ